MAVGTSRDQGRLRVERLNDGLSALTVGSGPPLVVLPGLGPGADLSAGVSRWMARSYTALARRFGRTVHLIYRPVDPPPGLTIAGLAGWHATAFRARFGGPVDVMGVSAGAVTALQLALDHPDTVRRLALTVAASRIGEQALLDLARMMELEAQGRSSARIASRLNADGPLRLLLLAMDGLSRGPARAPGEVALVATAQTWDVTDRLGELSQPVLLVGGGRDRIMPPELVRATAAGIRNARLVMLPQRGHFSTLFDRRRGPAIKAFLAEPIPGTLRSTSFEWGSTIPQKVL
jgi:pimeloyl-ACP methyl ester carboxylesterase